MFSFTPRLRLGEQTDIRKATNNPILTARDAYPFSCPNFLGRIKENVAYRQSPFESTKNVLSRLTLIPAKSPSSLKVWLAKGFYLSLAKAWQLIRKCLHVSTSSFKNFLSVVNIITRGKQWIIFVLINNYKLVVLVNWSIFYCKTKYHIIYFLVKEKLIIGDH